MTGAISRRASIFPTAASCFLPSSVSGRSSSGLSQFGQSAFLLQAASQGPAAAAEVRAATSVPGPFTFTTPLQLPKPPPQPTDIFFIADGEPEIKVDIDGNVYASAINGVPGGTDLWKSTN